MEFPVFVDAMAVVEDLVTAMVGFLVDYVWFGFALFFGILGARWMMLRGGAGAALAVGGAVVTAKPRSTTPPSGGGGGGPNPNPGGSGGTGTGD